MIIIEIQWFGNSTFLLKTKLGKRVFIDPFNALNSFDSDISANIITLSKKTTLNTKLLAGNTESKLIFSNDSYSDNNIRINGYLSHGDNAQGLKRGENFIFSYEIDDLKLCHLGYLGEILNDEMIKLLRNTDILFIPIGGNLCLNGSEAFKLSQYLLPKYIFPMCYRVTNSDFYYNGPREFISSSKKLLIHKDSIIDTTSLPKSSNSLTILLDCK